MNKKRKLFKTEKIEEKKIKEYEIKEILISKEEEEQEEEKDEEENENKKETNNIINLEENDQKPKYYSPDEIKNLLQKQKKKYLKVFNCYKIDLINIDIQKKLIGEKKVRKRRTNSEILKDKLENPIIIKKKYKLGRKEKEDNSERLHNKYKDDNIIKKIKKNLFYYLSLFINVILNEFNCNKNIMNLNYKENIGNLKKEENLGMLKMKLKDLLSLNISDKYKSCDKNMNKLIIKEILTNYGENELIKNIFNLEFKDWIDIFLMKKELTILKKYKIKFKRIDHHLKELIKNEEKEDYLTNYIYLLYNYEIWFYNKKGRKGKDKKEE